MLIPEQTLCQLGNFVYPYNPREDKNPHIKLVSLTSTLQGRYVTDWGTSVSRQDIEQTFEMMDAETFLTLDALAMQAGTLTFIDQFGAVYTVVALPPTYDRIIPGGEAYTNVRLRMHVISQP